MSEVYKTIADSTIGEFKDRGSKFIAYSFPINTIEEATSKISIIKKEHPKARHHCYAYRLGIDKNIYRANDDGEPSGTAGKPILGQIDSFGLTNVIVIVVRYFGGILLGTGGLINAYREAAKDALSKATIVEQKLMYATTVRCDYTMLPVLMNQLKRLEIKIIETDFTEVGIVNIMADKVQLERLSTIRGLSIEVSRN